MKPISAEHKAPPGYILVEDPRLGEYQAPAGYRLERNYRKRMGNGYGGASLDRRRARGGLDWLEVVKATAARLRAVQENPPPVGEFIWYTSSKVLPRLLGSVIGEKWSRWVFSPSHGGFLWLAESPSELGRMLEWGPGEWAEDETTSPVAGYASVWYLARGGRRVRVRVPDSAIKRATTQEATSAPAAPAVPPEAGGDQSKERADGTGYRERAELRKRVLALFKGRTISSEQGRNLDEWLKLASNGEIKEWLAKAEGGGK